jgi:hypothetical protein
MRKQKVFEVMKDILLNHLIQEFLFEIEDDGEINQLMVRDFHLSITDILNVRNLLVYEGNIHFLFIEQFYDYKNSMKSLLPR